MRGLEDSGNGSTELSAVFRRVGTWVFSRVAAWVVWAVTGIWAVVHIVCVARFVFAVISIVHNLNTILSPIECAERIFLYKKNFYKKMKKVLQVGLRHSDGSGILKLRIMRG